MSEIPGPAKSAPRQVLADHVYDELIESLVDGRVAAGSALNIDALAREMEVSQTPIREALARLEATGLVRRTALKGYRVTPILSTEELVELMDARLVLEPVNAYLACNRATDALVAALDKAIADLAAAPVGSTFAEFREYLEADERFHVLIAEAAANRFMFSAYSALGGLVQRMRLFAGRGVTDAREAIHEHGKIRDAFADGNPDAARSAMTEHLLAVKTRSVSESLALE
jgi:DNA-binding GntR family transcriptional regulator